MYDFGVVEDYFVQHGGEESLTEVIYLAFFDGFKPFQHVKGG